MGLSALLGDNWDNRGDAEHGDKGECEAPNVEAPEDVALAEELHTAACSEVDEDRHSFTRPTPSFALDTK